MHLFDDYRQTVPDRNAFCMKQISCQQNHRKHHDNQRLLNGHSTTEQELINLTRRFSMSVVVKATICDRSATAQSIIASPNLTHYSAFLIELKYFAP